MSKRYQRTNRNLARGVAVSPFLSFSDKSQRIVSEETGGIEMALSKAMLRGYGLNDEQVQAIIDGHMESVTGLQDEVEKHKS